MYQTYIPPQQNNMERVNIILQVEECFKQSKKEKL